MKKKKPMMKMIENSKEDKKTDKAELKKMKAKKKK